MGLPQTRWFISWENQNLKWRMGSPTTKPPNPTAAWPRWQGCRPDGRLAGAPSLR